jgi:hypothetical protein
MAVGRLYHAAVGTTIVVREQRNRSAICCCQPQSAATTRRPSLRGLSASGIVSDALFFEEFWLTI